MTKLTKIVCTIGPSSTSVEILLKLFKAGMNVARLNFSHGTYADHLIAIKNIRLAAQKSGLNIAIMQDLQGPKIRIGLLPAEGIPVKKGQKLIFDTGTSQYSVNKSGISIFPVQYKHLHKDLKPKDIVLVEDGLIETQVNSIKGTQITVTASRDCKFKSHKGINIPTASISADPLTTKDLKDLKFGIANNVDYVALSFVRSASDVKRLRTIIKRRGSNAQIVVKIERHEAITNLEEIIELTDGVMVARGDLGVETPAEGIPLLQKKIIKMALIYGKPVIVATEMLQSMVENPRATRAEVSDAANAVFGRTDAFMLSNETAVGKYPLEAVQTLNKVALSIESFLDEKDKIIAHHQEKHLNDTDELCIAATALAQQIKARAIVAVTKTGYTACHLAKQRSFTEIITITDNPQVKRQLALVWGLNNIIISKAEQLAQIKSLLTKQKVVKTGDKIVLVSNAGHINKNIILLQF